MVRADAAFSSGKSQNGKGPAEQARFDWRALTPKRRTSRYHVMGPDQGQSEVDMTAQVIEKHPLGALGRIGIVVGMHAALLLVLLQGFGLEVPQIEIPPDLESTIIDDRTPDDAPPTLPDFKPTHTIDVALPDPPPVPIDFSPPETAITATVEPTDLVQSGSALPVPRLIAPRADPRHPLTQPPYPATDIREGNEGSVDLELYVLPNGRIGDARVVRSSGFERLDQSAVDEAKKRWRLLPATRDGAPIAQWHRLRVKFELKKP